MNISCFEVSIYGDLIPFEKNPLLSLARVKIFYKGLNRNRTFITDEFAEKLLASLPYTPVSGIWDDEEGDYTDHGESREEGKIYGIVPEQPNVRWETFTDKDGVDREYACCDVVLFTTRYEHARHIVDKPHSMELYDKSIKGSWKIIEGVKCYEYTDGCFIGLQVLGTNVEPCFEGAAFYTYAQSLKEMVDMLQQYSLNGGKQEMVLDFKLSDREKFDKIFNLLNPTDENGVCTFRYAICDIYDDYVLVYDYENGEHYRCYYTKNDETDSVEIGELIKVFIVDVTEEEFNELKRIQELEGNFVNIASKYQNLSTENATLNQRIEEVVSENGIFSAKIEELNDAVSNSAAVIEKLNSELAGVNDLYAKASAQIDELNAYRNEIENNKKVELVKQYSMLEQETIDNFMAIVNEKSFEELENALKIAYVNENAKTIFAKNSTATHLIPEMEDGDKGTTGAAGLINKHKNVGGNK